nr:MAG TPA: hypothetical protein [Caudoviricetes sp.]
MEGSSREITRRPFLIPSGVLPLRWGVVFLGRGLHNTPGGDAALDARRCAGSQAILSKPQAFRQETGGGRHVTHGHSSILPLAEAGTHRGEESRRDSLSVLSLPSRLRADPASKLCRAGSHSSCPLGRKEYA